MEEKPSDLDLAIACAKSHLIDFSILISNGKYQPTWFHEDVADKLMAVERGEIDRLMLFVPPRHGKSQLSTINFPAWYLGRNPDKEIVTASYSAELAKDFGGKTRQIVSDPLFYTIFNIGLRDDEKSKAKWSTTKGGSYTSVGVGGPLTGRGANVLIIDDPIKNREEAESSVYRNKVWDWYRSTALTRLQADKSAVIIILTRWHEDDLAGRILAESEPGRWTIVEYPAIATKDEQNRKRGDALWPEKFSVAMLNERKKEIGSYNFAALYQQQPVLQEDQEFKPEWVQYIDQEDLDNKRCSHYLTIDTAISKRDQADFTGIVENAVDNEGFWHISSTQQKFNPKELIDFLFTKHQQKGYTQIGIEETVYLQAIQGFLDDEMRKRNIYLPIIPLKHNQTNKEVRIRGLIPRYQSRSIIHVKGKNNDLEQQMWSFPMGAHDDIIDALAYMPQIVKVSGAKPNHYDNSVRFLAKSSARFQARQQGNTNYE